MASETVPIRPCKILHIDTNPGDSLLLKRALSGVTHVTFEHVATFDGALQRLRNQALGERFNLIIMDWTLPPYTGAEMLAFLKADSELRPIPVIIFTGISDPKAIKKAYDAFASCVLIKPGTLDEFSTVAKEIERFWLRRAELPFCDTPGQKASGTQ